MMLPCLFFLTAVIPGVHLQRNNGWFDSVLPFEAPTYQPALQPSEAAPPIGIFMVKTITGQLCIKATMAAEYIVIEKKKSWYLNLDPSRVRTSGYCGNESAVLCLTLPHNAASLQFNFRKEKNIFYVDKLTAHVSPLPVCQGCASKITTREENEKTDKTYSGLLDHDKLFAAANGQSFKCKSEKLLSMSSELSIKLVHLQIQAFTLPKGQYGEEVECWADYNKRVFTIVVGATVVGLLLIAALTLLFIKDRRGYDRL